MALIFSAKSIWKSKAPIRACFLLLSHPLYEILLQRTCLKDKVIAVQVRACLEYEVIAVQVHALCVLRRKNTWIVSLYIVHGFLRCGIYLSLIGVSWVQPSNAKDVLVAGRRRMKKRWGSWSLENGSFGYLVGYLDWDKSMNFSQQRYVLSRFQAYFLRTLYDWNVVLKGNSSLKFLDFEDCIMDESFKAWCYWCVTNTALDYLLKNK